MKYELTQILQSRKVLTEHIYFPDLPAFAPGYSQRHTPILTISIPTNADMVKVTATTTVCAKNATLHPPQFLWDFRFPQPPAPGAKLAGGFLNIQLRAIKGTPIIVNNANPPGFLMSIYSGENMLDENNIRPYYQPIRWGFLAPIAHNEYDHVALFVSPNSEGCKNPQHMWVSNGEQYSLMTMECFKLIP